MSITASVPSAASIGAFSPEIATAKAGAGDYDTALANSFRTFASQVVVDLTAMDTELSGIPAPTAATKLLYDNGTAYVETAAGTAAQVPVVNAGATAPVYVSISGDATLAATGALTVTKLNGSLFQSGVATLVAGDSGAIAATVTANTRIIVSGKTPNTTALTVTYAALGADRSVGAPGSFRIKSLLADGTINVADVSTVDWIAFG